ncbi:hypothetical protein V6N13_116279 [Hibiscus sabdariffa]
MVHPMLKVGMIFADKEVLKKTMVNYGLQNWLHMKFKRNDLRRVNFICKLGYPWVLWSSRQNPTVVEDLNWQIKTLKNEHSCSKDYGKINLSSRAIAEKYLHFFVSDINFSIHSLHESVKKDFISHVHQSKLYRTRVIAIEIIERNHKDQYSRIYDYLGELRLSNPGTTTICKLDEKVFEHFYICMQACKDGFKAGCRPIICLDGCHLKGYHEGHLLTVVGIDANDSIYPIAFVAVENRQKGLKGALAEYFSYSEHRFYCVLEARLRPIITMLKEIRNKIIQRIAKKKAKANKWTGVLCQKIQKKLEAATEMSHR